MLAWQRTYTKWDVAQMVTEDVHAELQAKRRIVLNWVRDRATCFCRNGAGSGPSAPCPSQLEIPWQYYVCIT